MDDKKKQKDEEMRPIPSFRVLDELLESSSLLQVFSGGKFHDSNSNHPSITPSTRVLSRATYRSPLIANQRSDIVGSGNGCDQMDIVIDQFSHMTVSGVTSKASDQLCSRLIKQNSPTNSCILQDLRIYGNCDSQRSTEKEDDSSMVLLMQTPDRKFGMKGVSVDSASLLSSSQKKGRGRGRGRGRGISR